MDSTQGFLEILLGVLNTKVWLAEPTIKSTKLKYDSWESAFLPKCALFGYLFMYIGG
jgi:hypothetical protein